MYVFYPSLFQSFLRQKKGDFRTDVFQNLIANGCFYAFKGFYFSEGIFLYRIFA